MKNVDEIEANIEEAWHWVNLMFPFRKYIPENRKSSYFEMPEAVTKRIPIGASILDFGAGPCDKTAMLSRIGYRLTAFDDLGDDWYSHEDNRERILNFAKEANISYILPNDSNAKCFKNEKYEAIILNNVIEHLHDSPKRLLIMLLGCLNPGGYIFIDVPNAANLRKRLDIIRGNSNYPSFESYYWSAYPWRGHVREYVKSDLEKLAKYLGLDQIEIFSHHYHLEKVSYVIRKIFINICRIMPGLRESWMLIGRKPKDWRPRNRPTEDEANTISQNEYIERRIDTISWD